MSGVTSGSLRAINHWRGSHIYVEFRKVSKGSDICGNIAMEAF